MHRMHNQPGKNSGPETEGLTIHWASRYDLFTGVMGLGVNRPNSKMVVELAQVKPGDVVLDVGCGTGNLTVTAAGAVGKNGAVYGIDPSPEMIEVAQKKGKQTSLPVSFNTGLIEKIDFPEATFDVVISRLVIHHLPGDLKKRGFAEVYRVLKPGGFFLIADFTPPSNPILNHITSAVVGPNMMQSNIWTIPPLLTETGFKDVASGRTRSAFLAYVSGRK